MSDIGYPLMRRWPLGPAQGLLKRYRARLRDVPTDRAGYAVVLDVHGTLEEVPSGVPLAKAHGIGRANSAIFVDLRPRTLETVVAVPCRGQHADFETHVQYHCEVGDPIPAVERDAHDVREELTNWTAARLRRAGEGFGLDDAVAFEVHAEAVLRRAFREMPPPCSAWMDVDLMSVAVPLAEKYRKLRGAQEDVTLSTDRQIHEVNEGDRLAGAKVEAEVSADSRTLRKRRRQIANESRLFQLEAGLDDMRVGRESTLRDARVRHYHNALMAGTDAMMALLAEQNPADFKQFLALKYRERDDLMRFVFEAIEHKVIDPVDVDSVGVIEIARRIIDSMRRNVPGVATLGPAAPETEATPSAEPTSADPAPGTEDAEIVIDLDPARLVEDADDVVVDGEDEYDLSFLDEDHDASAEPSVNGAAGRA